MRNKLKLNGYLISLAVFIVINPFICCMLKRISRRASEIANTDLDIKGYIALDVLSNMLVAIFILVGVFLVYKIMKHQNRAVNAIVTMFLFICSSILPCIDKVYIWIMAEMNFFFTNLAILFVASVLSWIYIDLIGKKD